MSQLSQFSCPHCGQVFERATTPGESVTCLECRFDFVPNASVVSEGSNSHELATRVEEDSERGAILEASRRAARSAGTLTGLGWVTGIIGVLAGFVSGAAFDSLAVGLDTAAGFLLLTLVFVGLSRLAAMHADVILLRLDLRSRK